MTQMRDPFEHHHPHEHEHDHDYDHGHGHAADDVALDPAQQSLADALRVCFFILKVAMAVLVIAYLFSGIFKVEQQQRAVRLLFGRIHGGELAPGRLYFSLPYPIMDKVFVETAPQDLAIDKAFWYSADPTQMLNNTEPLNPERDGSLITGDANIIHVKWNVTYAVTDVIDYLHHVGSPERAQQIVQAAAEDSIVKAVARITADSASKGNANADAARELTQRRLAELDTGITVLALTSGDPQFPLPVKDAFDAVTNADARRAQQITDAQKERNRILQEAAGGAWEPLWRLVHDYEQGLQSGEQDKLADLTARLDAALDALELVDPVTGQVRKIGGEVSRMMYDAHSYRSNVVQEMAAKVNTFERLRGQWKDNRRVLEESYLADARRLILGNARETFYVPGGQLYLELNRDPNVERRAELERLTEEQKLRARRGQ